MMYCRKENTLSILVYSNLSVGVLYIKRIIIYFILIYIKAPFCLGAELYEPVCPSITQSVIFCMPYFCLNNDHRSLFCKTKIVSLNPNSIGVGGGGGPLGPLHPNFRVKGLCSHNNNTVLIKQISLFDTALVMTNT